jgi:hypothetical protein
MNEKEIILSSYSLGDLTFKLFGKSNKTRRNKTIKFLEENGFDLSIFEGKNKNEKYEKITKECPVCKNSFQTKKGYSKETFTCSISCSNSLNPKRIKNLNPVKKKREKREYKKKEKIIKEKIYIKRVNKKIEKICVICNSYFFGLKNSKVCSKDCFSKFMKNSINERILNGNHKGWTTRNISSYPEDFFKKVLDNLEIKFDFNFPVAKSSLDIEKDKSSYFLDFYIQIGERKIDLEIDGAQHELEDRKKSDEERDFYLIRKGYEVYRIKWKNPINDKNKNYMKEEIEKLKTFLFTIS